MKESYKEGVVRFFENRVFGQAMDPNMIPGI